MSKHQKSIQLIDKVTGVPIPVGELFNKYSVSNDMFSPDKHIYTVLYNKNLYSIVEDHFAFIDEEDESMLEPNPIPDVIKFQEEYKNKLYSVLNPTILDTTNDYL
jgi:hypothetical protein